MILRIIVVLLALGPVATPLLAKEGKTAPGTTLTPPKAPGPDGKGIILTDQI